MLNPARLFGLIRSLLRNRDHGAFKSSSGYWLDRYEAGGTSGAGSYSHLAEFKARIINALVRERNLNCVIEFGCGDGNQLRHATYPSYLGIDISPLAVEKCENAFASDPTKRFMLLADYAGEQADLALSLDVIYHLVEDHVFEHHMHHVFRAARKAVVIYSSNDDNQGPSSPPHVRHRRFTDWVQRNVPEWHLEKQIPNEYPYDGDHNRTTFADFYIYSKSPAAIGSGS